jgi:DinB superfamily
MTLPQQIAKHFRDVHFGGNWTSVNLKDTLANVTWQQATTKIDSLNTIAALVYHINYYVSAVTKVLQGNLLDAHDKFSFDLPPINSQQDWENLLRKFWADAENLAGLIEQLPESKLDEIFVQEKFGTYHRNLHGIIEHTHYHLGQIVLIKKLLSQPAKANTD